MIVYYASNNKFMCFANESSARAMLGDVLGPAIMARALHTDMMHLIGSLAVGRLFGAAEIANACALHLANLAVTLATEMIEILWRILRHLNFV